MSRIRLVAALAVFAALALAATALASSSKVTGGSTTITASSAAATVLSDNHITVTPIAPATQSGSTLTFPIRGGRINLATHRGVLRHKGGVSLSNGTQTATLRRLTIVAKRHGVALYAVVRAKGKHSCRLLRGKHHRKACKAGIHLAVAKIANITDVTVANGTATGTAHITRFTARLVNRLAGKHVVHAGDVLGTIAASPTVA